MGPGTSANPWYFAPTLKIRHITPPKWAFYGANCAVSVFAFTSHDAPPFSAEFEVSSINCTSPTSCDDTRHTPTHHLSAMSTECHKSAHPNPSLVPPLPLDSIAPSKDPHAPLTCGSDRSTGTRGTAPSLVGSTPPASLLPAGPLPPPPPPAAASPLMDSLASSPHSTRMEMATPRRGFNLASLSLASPTSLPTVHSNQNLRTPLGASPQLSPHSPKSPSMMSPLRLVGTRSPCSVKLSGSGWHRLTGGSSTHFQGRHGHRMRYKDVLLQGVKEDAQGGSDVCTSTATNQQPLTSRALPFTTPTPAATAAAAVERSSFERFKTPQFHGRELSFSDLLIPGSMKQQVPSTVPAMQPLIVVKPINCTTAATATVQAMPVVQSPRYSDGQLTPRKRPRKSAAPQRADDGSHDGGDEDNNNNNSNKHQHRKRSHSHTTTAGGGGGGGGRQGTATTSSGGYGGGESSDGNAGFATSNDNDTNNNNSAVAMTWEGHL